MEFIGEEFNHSVEVAIDKLDKRIENVENSINTLLKNIENILKTVDILLQGEILKSDPTYKVRELK